MYLLIKVNILKNLSTNVLKSLYLTDNLINNSKGEKIPP